MFDTARLLTLTVVVCILVIPSLVSCDCQGPAFCTLEYNPVCATFRKTYSNPCMLQADICNQAQQGFEYVEYSEGDCCVRSCPEIKELDLYGCDGQSYDNTCIMQAKACTEKRCIYRQELSAPPL